MKEKLHVDFDKKFYLFETLFLREIFIKSTIMAFADSHLRDSGSFAPFNKIEENGLSAELNNILLGFDFVARTVKREQPAFLFFLGDLFHTPDSVTTSCLYAAHVGLSQIREACSEVGTKFYMMPGNHDFLNDRIGIHSLITLGAYGEIIDTNVILDLGGLRVGVVQFNSDKELVNNEIERMKENEVDLILTHLDFKGARYDNGNLSNSCISPNIGVTCLAGDIHNKNSVGNVHYCGSLVQNKFGREDLKAVGGLIEYDPLSKKIKHFPNNLSKHYITVYDIDVLNEMEPNSVVAQIRCDIPKETQEKLLPFFDFVHIPEARKMKDINKSSVGSARARTPNELLQDYVQEHKPEALEIFIEVLK